MPMFHRRKLGSVSYTAGGRETLEIPRPGVLTRLFVRVRFTNTNGGTAPTGLRFQTLARIIRRLEVVVGGRATVFNQEGAMIAARAACEYSTVADGMEDTVDVSVSTGTAYDITLPIDFWLPRGRVPDDTALDLRRVQSAMVAITWGDASDLFNTANGAAVSAVTCEIEAEYVVDPPADQVYMTRIVDQVTKTLDASNDNFQIELARADRLFLRNLFIATTVDRIGNNTILSAGSAKLETGTLVIQHADAPVIQAENKLRYSPIQGLITGLYAMNVSPWGEGSFWVNTGNLNADLFLTLDAAKQAGTNHVTVSREYVRAAPAA